MIRNVLFDLGGVLVDLDVRQSIRAFSKLLAPVEDVAASRAEGKVPVTGLDLLGGGESELVRQYQTGAISTETFTDTILQACKPGTTRVEVLEAWFAMLGTIPEQRMTMLRRLKAAGKHVFILSNINASHVEWVHSHYPELYDICDDVFFSNEIQIAKPDSAAYRYVVDHAGILAAETLYIDDLEQNIRAGRAAGFVSLQALGDEWLDEAEKLTHNS